MNLNKHAEYFDPRRVEEAIHIIGVGAIGSTVAELFARLGFTHLYLYDFDIVSDHNITNQMYRFIDVGKPKLDALAQLLTDINPEIELVPRPRGYTEMTTLSGYVFLCVDSIELRKQIVDKQKTNTSIISMFDFRMGLTSAQYYAARWNDTAEVERFRASMNFTAEEAKNATPISACGTTLSITPTVRSICSFGVANFINMLQDKPYKTLCIVDPFACNITAFPME